MSGRLNARAFAEARLNPVALEADTHGLTLYAVVSDRDGHVASVEQTGSEGQGATSVAWMTAEEAVRRHARIFLVLMRRWGDPEGHTYPLGIFQTLPKAHEEGEKEAHYRGGKYTAEIIHVPLGVSGAERFGDDWPFAVVLPAERSL